MIAQFEKVDVFFSQLTDPIDVKIIESTPNLKVGSNVAACVDKIELDACAPKSIPVGHTPNVLTEGKMDHWSGVGCNRS